MKNIVIILMCFPLLGLTQNITDSLLLYYPMDGNANDLSGNSFHGTPSGVTSVPNRYGVPNSAYYFDGVNDYIDFPLNDTLKPDFPLTIAFWAKLKVLGIQDSEFLNTDFVQNNYHGVWLNVNSLGYFGIGFGGGQGGCSPYNRISYKAYELAVDTGIWYHFTGVIFSSTNMRLYINCNNAGANFASGSGPINIAYSNNTKGTLGRMDYQIANPAAQFYGNLDEFSYWERALSSAEVYTLCDSLPLINSAQSWNCVNNACIDPGNGSGTYTTINSCQAACVSTSVSELNAERKLLRIVDVLGRESSIRKQYTLFYFYDDGTVEKRIIIE